MLVGPSQGWAGDTTVKTETRTVAVGQTQSARLDLDTGGYSATVHGLPQSTGADRALVAATVHYTGTFTFSFSGTPQTAVTMAAKGNRWFQGWFFRPKADPWDIGLDPSTPLSLIAKSASGSLKLDLSPLQLTDLEVDVSSGDTRVDLPARGGQRYGARLQLSSGDLQVQTAAGANIDMTVGMSSGDSTVTLGADSDGILAFSGSSGDFHLHMASGQAYRLEVKRVSSGDVHRPPGLVQISQGNGKEGVWETQGLASAAHRLLVTVEISSGDVTIGE
jgi:hypothetical protein